MATSIYLWFIMDDGHYPSVFASGLASEEIDPLVIIGISITSILALTLIAGFISRLLFSFGSDELE